MRIPAFTYVSVEDWILKRCKGKSVLHLGCAGDFLEYGANACLHVQLSAGSEVLYGVELDNKALAQVKTWLPEDKSGRVRYFCGDVQQLPKLAIDRKFQVVLAGSIIEHLSNPGAMLDGITQYCEPHGEVIIVTPSPFGLLQYLRVAFRKEEAVNPQHTCWFSPPTLIELCSRYGLEPLEWYTGYGWRPPTRKWTLKKRVGVPFFQLFPHLGGSLIGVFKVAEKS